MEAANMRTSLFFKALYLAAATTAVMDASRAAADITIQAASGSSGSPRFTGNSFANGSGPGGSPSSSSTQANVNLAIHGGSGSTSGGLGNVSGTASFGTAVTNVAVSSTASEFRVRIDGVGDVNAPNGYSGLQISASLSFFDTAIHITGSGAMPFTIQRTGDLAGVTWALVPESGSGASIIGSTLTPGNYRFDDDADAQQDSPSAFITYNFGNGGSGNQHRTFSGEFALVLGSAGAGVCCRGATCSTTITQANCIAPGGQAGALFVSGASACNGSIVSHTPCCTADYTKSGGVAVTDIFAFLNDWFASRPTVVLGGNGTSGTPTVQNIFDFLSVWFAGC